jgi:hypothetical protein
MKDLSYYWGPVLKQAARPIWLDKKDIQSQVQNLIMPQIERWAKRHPQQEEPIDAVKRIAVTQIDIADSDDRGSVSVTVIISSQKSKVAYTACLGGRANGTEVEIFLNGAMTPKEIQKHERLQPLWSCRYETCIPYGIYSLLIHELTHIADVSKRQPGYSPSKVKEEGETAWGPYLNDPGELRAFMQNLVDEAVNMASKEAIRTNAAKSPNPNQKLMDIVLALSTTWGLASPHLKPRNKALLLKAVYDGLKRAGYLFGEAKE